ncbi:MFS transporter [Salinicola rhizosphaerae]|uniref:MFS transporter n=1 Tax=Salinicola rhizosphaerae TaxID=1443141 RepID=A0ABQ3DQI9_9GAMM|nr:MFS transporter [Salinicola rhizosphaerae]GHB12078.1 MFS transporter [Salinicola rhizosphaerae]
MSTSGSASQPVDDPILASAVKKVKWHILPLFVAAFIVNYIDRVNIGFVREHLNADLGIGVAAFGLGAGLFFVGYAIFEVPSNMLLERFGARAWLTRIMFSWGIVATLMTFIQSETHFYILRFLLGVAEAGFFPGIIYYFTRWLPAGERGKAMAIFLSGSAIASILSGPICGALLSIDAFGWHGWQWMFFLEGIAALALTPLFWFYLRSNVHDAEWLSREEQDVLKATIEHEQAEREAQQGEKIPTWRLLMDPKIVLFCLIFFSISLTIYGMTFWLPTIIHRMGNISDFDTGLYNSIPWIISIAAMYAFAALAQRFRFQQGWVAASLVIASLGMFLSTTANPVFAFVAICFAALGFKASASLFWPVPQNYLDARIAAPVIALINSLGNLGGFVAPTTFGFLEARTGSYENGLYMLGTVTLVAAVLVLLTAKKRGGGRGEPRRVEAPRRPAEKFAG